MHFQRWLTGLVAVPILIYLIGFGHRWIFYSLLFLVSIVGQYEFYRVAAPGLSRLIRYSCFLLTFLVFISLYRGQVFFLIVIIIFMVLIPMIFSLFKDSPVDGQTVADIGKAVMGPVYVGLPLALLIPIDRFYLINYPVKGIWIFFLLSVTFASDTGAFYFGRLFGKHKLYETISPKKTWEGAAGGLICSVIISILFLRILGPRPVDPWVIILVMALSAIGQLGDLAESMLKRSQGVKDSGSILPGHGGVLDRIDSLLFSIPVLYLFLVWTMP